MSHDDRLNAAIECLQTVGLVHVDGTNITLRENVYQAVSGQMSIHERQQSWKRAIAMVNACPLGCSGAFLYDCAVKLLIRWNAWHEELDPPVSVCRLLLNFRSWVSFICSSAQGANGA